ncbi:esterase family protein [Mucilaginibacter sp. 21P]|uniref:alpha/beta hydrolase n=1 Tax=Mucilaginibacter sp. 21P TaxID=2778902 RepID=UPI001C589E88|nr:alpha/beta hydrolase-fold protein [Mucilaginibacter sp. 21P]QXV66489.1 esterase family protein [Mucilaginibacter sp. 21P]
MLKLRLKLLTLALLTASSVSIAQDTARIVTENIHIPQLNRDRSLRIYLPAGYASSKQKYPVIYMHDGQNLFSGTKDPAFSWYIDSLLKTYPAKKQVIVVGINNGPNRIMEYNAWDSKYGKQEGVAYTDFIVKTLKPHIDSTYRTLQDAKHTVIAGSSMGALISMYAAVKYPQLFGTAGVFSPSFWIAPDMYKMVSTEKPVTKNRFFLACGDQEGDETTYVARMDSLLSAKEFDRGHVPAPLIVKNAKHNEAQWRKAFAVFYAWWIKQ